MEALVTAKVRRWTDAIAATDIAGVIPELTEFLSSGIPEKTTNKVTLKLLQHLSHAAYKCDRSNVKFVDDMARMTCLLCSATTAVLNTKKFYSSIYHVMACALEMSLYRETMEICAYLLPERDLCRADETITGLEIFEPLSNLWHKTAANVLKDADFADGNRRELFASIVNYELNLTKLICPVEPSRNALARILSHSRRIMLKSHSPDREKWKNSMLDFAINGGIALTNDRESDGAWQLICELITSLIGKDVDATSIGPNGDNHRRYFDAFRSTVTPVRSEDWSSEIDGWLEDVERMLVPREVLKPYSYAVLQLLTSAINYWEDCAKRKETTENASAMILGMLRLSKKHAGVIGTFEISECRCKGLNCRAKTDLVNELILTIKCLSLVARSVGSLTSEAVRISAVDMAVSSLDSLGTIKAANCDQSNLLWPTWGAAIYNTSVFCENTFAAVSVKLYGVLATSVVIIAGVKKRTRLWGFEDSLGTILHRLSSVCLKEKLYARAKRAASMNCLLSHDRPETKAFRDWANIKRKDRTAEGITIVEYLRSNELEIARVRLDDYDLANVCLREIMALQESQWDSSVSIMAVLDELERLNAESSQYLRAVQMLGYHWLNFETDLSIREYLKKATIIYEREKSRERFRCAYAAVKFYEFVERTREITRNTEKDMRSALVAMTGRAKGIEIEGNANEYDVVPAYSAINTTITSELESCLEQAFQRWREFADSYSTGETDDWTIRCTIHVIKIAGEYSRLYHFESLENEAWSITYKLANEISDSLSVVYATSRSLTSRNFRPRWIAETAKHADDIANSSDLEALEILARYRLCLANRYYENDDREKANEAYVCATNVTEIKFMRDFGNFLLAKEIEMKYRLGRDVNDDQSSYTTVIVHYLYTLLSMDDHAEATIYGRKEKQLYDYEILLDYTNNLALRMNSLLSYREISAHLTKRLGTAQKLVTSLRVAECLKFLCHIDISRGQLDDCEVKLQGLEHILEIEAFDVTMKSELSSCGGHKVASSNFTEGRRRVDAVRDIGQSDASPVLRKKVFAKPDFMLHGCLCSCFKCTNTRYQYLVFAATHVRAQLFALQRNSTVAFQHFHGAMAIRKCILGKHRLEEVDDSRCEYACAGSQREREAIEYVMFLVNYCRFLKWSVPNVDDNEVRDIAVDALELCEKYHLRNHPVYVAVNEFLFQCRFEKVFTKDDYSKFMVADTSEIDVSRYEQSTAQDSAICVTPVRDMTEKRPITLRRKKTPPFLNLDRVPIDLSAESMATTPTATTISTLPATKTRRLRRRICDDEDYYEDANETPGTLENSSVPAIEISQPGEGHTFAKYSANRVTRNKKSVEKSDRVEQIGVHENSEVTKRLESLQLDAVTRTRTRKKCHVNDATGKKSSTKTGKKMNEVTELFNDMSMDKKQRGNSLVSRSSAKSQLFADKTESVLPNEKDSVSSSALSSDVATSSENEEAFGRRTSARLRKKGKDADPSGASKNSVRSIVPESYSDDEELVVDTRPRRRLYTSKERSLSSTNIVTKNNWKRTTRSEEG